MAELLAGMTAANSPVRKDMTVRKPSVIVRIARTVAILALAGGLGYAACVYLPPYLLIKQVVVSGNVTIPEADVLTAAALPAGENIVTVDMTALKRRILSDSRIARVEASRVLPSSLSVKITERKPVACILIQTASGLKPVLTDAAGYVYAFTEGIPADLPVISGIQFENFVPGQKLPPELTPVFKSLGNLVSTAPTLISVFSEIRIVRLAAGDIELLLYPVHVPIPVRTQAVLDEKTLRSVILVLDILRDRQSAGSIEEVDFRTGTVVYRTKEGQPG
ncbi:MAG: FtsQ-type POTRA domain-containing protein [Rectinemataceae bacterium]|nr:FtsQ-type POTRA domain-containing protein [Rectinemataceae bacterium]